MEDIRFRFSVSQKVRNFAASCMSTLRLRYPMPRLDPATSQYMMVFQFADGGSLEEYLRRTNNSLTWPTRLRLATGITEGLAHIHSHGVLHKDLHSGNILIHGGRPLIADFGCSRLSEYDGTRTV